MADCATSPNVRNFVVPFKSRNFSWTAGVGGNDFPTDFLKQAISEMQNPMIDEMVIRYSASVTTANGGGAARASLYPQMLPRIFIRDKDDILYDLKGSSGRVNSQMEYGLMYSDVTSGNNIGNLGNNVTQTIIGSWRIPVAPPKMARPQDCRIPARNLLDGQILLDYSPALVGPVAANQITVNSANFEIHCHILDEGPNPEAKTRLVWRDFVINNNEQQWTAIRGRLRHVGMYIGDVGENKATSDTWAAQKITSRVLEIVSRQDDVLREEYFGRSWVRHSDPAGVSATEDTTRLGTYQPIFMPHLYQGLTELPEIPAFDFLTDNTFGSGTFIAADLPRMIACYSPDRPGCATPAYNKMASGATLASSFVAPSLRNKLPGVDAPKTLASV